MKKRIEIAYRVLLIACIIYITTGAIKGFREFKYPIHVHETEFIVERDRVERTNTK